MFKLGKEYRKVFINGNWTGLYEIIQDCTYSSSIKPKANLATRFSSLNTDGKMTVKVGFIWDGASGAIDTDTILRGSCFHDLACNMMALGLLDYDTHWDPADDMLVEISEEDGMRDVRQKTVYAAVKLWGAIRYKLFN